MMRNLLGFKLGALKFVDSISNTLKDTIEDAKTNSHTEIATNSLSINFNKVVNSGLSIYLKGMFLTQENKTDYLAVQAMHKFGASFPVNAYANAVFEVVGCSSDEFVAKLGKALEHPFL
jgi:hypothetical protein